MNQDPSQADRAVWHGWLLKSLEDSPNPKARCEVASLLCLSGLEWENDGAEHREFLERLREVESKERSKEVRLQIGLAIDALDPEIKRRRRPGSFPLAARAFPESRR